MTHPNRPIKTLRFAQTPEAVLSLRDEHKLRRYLLDAPTAQEQACRQMALLECATRKLAQLPSPSPAHVTTPAQVVQLSLIGWPLVLTMPRCASLRRRFCLQSPANAHLAQAFLEAFAMTFGAAPAYLRVQGALDVALLAGLHPLQLQSALCAEASRMARRPKANSNANANTGTDTNSDPRAWPCTMDDAATQEFCQAGPIAPAAFVFLAYVAWPYDVQPPGQNDPLGSGRRRMHALCQALFTHFQKSNPQNSQQREVCRPSLQLGIPGSLHASVLQAQSMQLAWMAEHCRSVDAQFHLESERLGSFITWNATSRHEYDGELATVRYSHDTFWRPEHDVSAVLERVAMAQGPGPNTHGF